MSEFPKCPKCGCLLNQGMKECPSCGSSIIGMIRRNEAADGIKNILKFAGIIIFGVVFSYSLIKYFDKQEQRTESEKSAKRAEESRYEPPNSGVVPTCQRLLNTAEREGIINHINVYGDSAHVYVDRGYYGFTYKEKEIFVSCIYHVYSDRAGKKIEAYVTDIYTKSSVATLAHGYLDIQK